MQTQKWVNSALLIGAGAFYLFAHQLVAAIWDLARLPVPEDWPFEPSHLIGFAMAAGVALWARSNSRANGFFNEVVLELSKVTWPNRKESVGSAGVVVVLVGIAALLLFVIDYIWGVTIRGILSL